MSHDNSSATSHDNNSSSTSNYSSNYSNASTETRRQIAFMNGTYENDPF